MKTGNLTITFKFRKSLLTVDDLEQFIETNDLTEYFLGVGYFNEGYFALTRLDVFVGEVSVFVDSLAFVFKHSLDVDLVKVEWDKHHFIFVEDVWTPQYTVHESEFLEKLKNSPINKEDIIRAAAKPINFQHGKVIITFIIKDPYLSELAIHQAAKERGLENIIINTSDFYKGEFDAELDCQCIDEAFILSNVSLLTRYVKTIIDAEFKHFTWKPLS